MNDFDYDVMQRKQLARSAYHRKRGSKSRKCPLSTDYMTQKQWKERNGDVVTVNLNRPMAWKDFKALTRDLQTEYIRHLQETYKANATKIADMFCVTPQTLKRELDAKGVETRFHAGKSMTRFQLENWRHFVNADDESDAIQEEQNEEQIGGKLDEEPTTSMNMRSFTLLFGGAIDADKIADSIRNILGDSAVGEVRIVCDLAA